MRSDEVERLFALFGYDVYKRAVNMLGTHHEAMDIVQDVFVELLERKLDFRTDIAAKAWLLKVATNKCRNAIRKQIRWKTVELSDFETAQSKQSKIEDTDLIRYVLARVDLKTAQIAVAHFLEGKTYDEIATEMGVSVPTVRRKVKKFINTAKKEVGQWERLIESKSHK